MPRGRTESRLNRTERRAKADKMYSRGHSVAEVAKALRVTWDTAKRYQREWNKQFHEEAKRNPGFLRDVITNTLKVLEEIDEMRRESWSNYVEAETSTLKAQWMNTLTKQQEQRTRVLGLFGVKQEFFIYVQNVQFVQNRLMVFMQQSLCPEDREKLEQFMIQELGEYLDPEVKQELALAEPTIVPKVATSTKVKSKSNGSRGK